MTQAEPDSKAAEFERALSPAEWPDRGYGLAVAHQPGDVIFRDGNEIQYFYQLRSGVVRSCRYHQQGRRHVVSFHLPGDIFGFEDHMKRQCWAECVSAAVLIAYRRPPVYAISQIDLASSRHLLALAIAALDRARAHEAALACHMAEARLAFFLLDMAARLGGETSVALPMPRLDIADYLGLRIESVSRALRRLKHDGLIAMPSPRLVVLKDKWALQTLSP